MPSLLVAFGVNFSQYLSTWFYFLKTVMGDFNIRVDFADQLSSAFLDLPEGFLN